MSWLFDQISPPAFHQGNVLELTRILFSLSFPILALKEAHTDLLEYLIRCGLQIQSDNQGRTILMHAARAGHVTVLKLIIEHAQGMGHRTQRWRLQWRKCSVLCDKGTVNGNNNDAARTRS